MDDKNNNEKKEKNQKNKQFIILLVITAIVTLFSISVMNKFVKDTTTQEITYNAVSYTHLLILAKHKKADGQIAGLYLIFYSIGRFVLEFFRGDLERGSVGSLSTSQFIAIFVFLAGVGIVAERGVRGKRTVNRE